MSAARALGFGLLLNATACTLNSIDYYAEVAGSCGYVPRNYASVDTTLTPDCRQALEKILRLDEDSFSHAPAGYRDKVIESFQALIGYPMQAPPQSRIFGVSPALAGAIPLAHWDILGTYPNPNQSVFNYVLGSYDAVVYMPPDGTVQKHTSFYQLTPTRREIRVYDGFWDSNSSDRKYAFRRANTLVHEARHGDGFSHEYCPSGLRQGEWECDPELLGPRGLEITYQLFLLHGGTRKDPAGDGPPALSPEEVVAVAQNICINVQNTLLHPFRELNDLIGPPLDCGSLTAAWVSLHEGL